MARHSNVTLASLVCALSLSACGHKESTSGQCDAAPSASNIKHLVLVVQENHSFDAYFGRYCQAPTGSNPSCTTGPACCEAGPDVEPGLKMAPTPLDDHENGAYDPDHQQKCELAELDNGRMDHYVDATPTCGDGGGGSVLSSACGCPKNFAYASGSEIQPYWKLAGENALADRYFQPIAGQSQSNNMYFARANYVFTDNDVSSNAIGDTCSIYGPQKTYTDKTIGDLLADAGKSWAWYAEGYQEMLDAQGNSPPCPSMPPADCPSGLPVSPCIYDPTDVPFEFYQRFQDNPTYMKDYKQFTLDAAAGHLPAVTFVKGYGFHSEHPGYGQTISAGATFVNGVIQAVQSSVCASDTLVLVTYDEGGGFFDHVSPPPTSTVDNQPYGTRVPLLAVGPFAKKNFVSHVQMEHSSIVKFIEWNWLGQQTGQLGTRDTVVNNIGSLLDPAKTGTEVPAQ